MGKLLLMMFMLIAIFWYATGYSQTVETLYPDEDKNVQGDLWTTIVATTGEQAFNFYFNKGRNKGLTNHYSGYNTLCVWVDSTSTSAPSSGDIDITAVPLVYDQLGDEIAAGGRYEAVLDANARITVKTAFDWFTNHADTLLSVFEVLNIGAADGVQIIIGNDDAEDIQVRLLLKQARDTRK